MTNESQEGNREVYTSKYKTESKLNKILRNCSENPEKWMITSTWESILGRSSENAAQGTCCPLEFEGMIGAKTQVGKMNLLV